MKRRSILGIAGAVAATLVITGSAFAASAGVTNGGFEAGTVSDAGHPGYQELQAGSTELAPWQITKGSVDWISSYWAPASGTQSIDLAGREPGAISQTIDTAPYQTYTVTFKLAGNTDSATNPAGGPAVKTVSVATTGNGAHSFAFDTTGKSPNNMGWKTETFTFKATGATTTITFTNTSPGYYGAALDDIQVAAPTGADCKSNGWKAMFDSVNHSFKNQGDCVSFFATDGRNLAAV